jgi:prepilin-type N-terminal cleavage/methylation domain-containing protein
MKSILKAKNDYLHKNFGFTLIELLIIIGIIAILAAIVFVSLNPMAKYQDARNARRWNDVTAILDAIKLHQVDNKGAYLEDIQNLSADLAYQIGNAGSNCDVDCSNPDTTLETTCINIGELSDNGYMPAIPYDPNASTASIDYTHYYLIKSTNGSITVGACDEEKGSSAAIPNISVSR